MRGRGSASRMLEETQKKRSRKSVTHDDKLYAKQPVKKWTEPIDIIMQIFRMSRPHCVLETLHILGVLVAVSDSKCVWSEIQETL